MPIDSKDIFDLFVKEFPSATPDEIDKCFQEVIREMEENHIILEFSYDKKYILPYNAGIEILKLFREAEKVTQEYSTPLEVHPLNTGLDVKLISHKEYCIAKMRPIINKLHQKTDD